ncbi:MAG: hypothetical protein U0996_01070 [Planctomycetaceae bacterium]
MRLQSFFQRLRIARESISRCLSFVALEPWTLIRPQSARRRGGRLAASTEVAEARLVLSASPLSEISNGLVATPESPTEAITPPPSSDTGFSLGDVSWEDFPATIDVPEFPDTLFPDTLNPGDDVEAEAPGDEPFDGIGQIIIGDPDALNPDAGDEQPDPGFVNDGDLPVSNIDIDTPEIETPEIDGGIHLSGSLEELLYYLMQDFDIADGLQWRAANGEFAEIFPVFSQAMGVVTLDTFPNQSAPLEVLISVSPADEINTDISKAETVIGVSIDGIDQWVTGPPSEQASYLQLAAVNAITAVIPEVPVVLTTNVAGAGLLRFVVMNGYGYPMQPMAREGGPVLTGEDETPKETDNGGIPILDEDPPFPTVEIGGIPGTTKDQQSPEPVRDNAAPPLPSVVMIAEDHSMVLALSTNDASRLVSIAPEVAGLHVAGDRYESPVSDDADSGLFANSDLQTAITQAALMAPEFWGDQTGWAVSEAARVRQDSARPRRLLRDQTELAGRTESERSADRFNSIQVSIDPSTRLNRSPITNEPIATALTVRLQPIPYSSQVQIRRYRAGHRQAAAAEYVELPVRVVAAITEERLEDNAPSLLRYVLNPRAPPRGPPSSECLIETFAENDLLERLRYSIAPRGPSLADSSSLSPGSVFFSGPRVSPVSLAI